MKIDKGVYVVVPTFDINEIFFSSVTLLFSLHQIKIYDLLGNKPNTDVPSLFSIIYFNQI